MRPVVAKRKHQRNKTPSRIKQLTRRRKKSPRYIESITENRSRDINCNIITTNHYLTETKPRRRQIRNTAITTPTPHHRQKLANIKTKSRRPPPTNNTNNPPPP
ncbi:hypothetical protein P8452_59344 [Trifolium repens]|nr:hypothetical protein P8452_59344 [Trifolium repens]